MNTPPTASEGVKPVERFMVGYPHQPSYVMGTGLPYAVWAKDYDSLAQQLQEAREEARTWNNSECAALRRELSEQTARAERLVKWGEKAVLTMHETDHPKFTHLLDEFMALRSTPQQEGAQPAIAHPTRGMTEKKLD